MASYFATFGYTSAISNLILMGKGEIWSTQLVQSSPRITLASYFATFNHISAISSRILMGKRENWST